MYTILLLVVIFPGVQVSVVNISLHKFKTHSPSK